MCGVDTKNTSKMCFCFVIFLVKRSPQTIAFTSSLSGRLIYSKLTFDLERAHKISCLIFA